MQVMTIPRDIQRKYEREKEIEARRERERAAYVARRRSDAFAGVC
jgi:hypothetical protein